MTSPNRYYCIDILRALAASSVLFSHLHLGDRLMEITFWSGGGLHPGVIVFIVVSGFCIHLPQALAPERQRRAGFWKYYAWRRFMRIAPLYWFAICLGILSILVVNSLTGNGDGVAANPTDWRPLGAALTFSFISGFTTPFADGAPLGNAIMSTVTVEVALYALYPAVLWLRRRLGWGWVFGLAGVLYLSTGLLLWSGFDPVSTERSLFTFFLYWWMGAYAVELVARRRSAPSPLRPGWGLTIGAYLLFLLLGHILHFKGAHYLTSPLLAFSTASLLYTWLTAERSNPGPHRPFSHCLAWVGERSYSLYAVNLPLITVITVFLGQRLAWNAVACQLACLALIAGVTLLSYRYIERPTHQWAKGYFRLLGPGLEKNVTQG